MHRRKNDLGCLLMNAATWQLFWKAFSNGVIFTCGLRIIYSPCTTFFHMSSDGGFFPVYRLSSKCCVRPCWLVPQKVNFWFSGLSWWLYFSVCMAICTAEKHLKPNLHLSCPSQKSSNWASHRDKNDKSDKYCNIRYPMILSEQIIPSTFQGGAN